MIDFAVFALPRSGTTWATAWLSHYASVIHDPLEHMTPNQIMEWGRDTEGPTGIVCTAGWMDEVWLTELCERIPLIFLWREPLDVQKSLERLSLPRLPLAMETRFVTLIQGHWGRSWRKLFDQAGARNILRTLLPNATFDSDHHAQLRDMHIEPAPHVVERWRDKARKAGLIDG